MTEKLLNKKKSRGQKTKKKLSDTAMKLFLEKGYNNVSVDEIVQASNSSKGAFYTHFKSKVNILDEKINESDVYYTDFYIKELKNSKEDYLTKIKKFISYSQNFLITLFPLDVFRVCAADNLTRSTLINSKMNKNREYYKILEELINKGKKNNEITKNIETEKIISWLVGVQRGGIYNFCIQENIDDHLVFIEELVELVICKIKV